MNAPDWYCVRMPGVDVQEGRHLEIQRLFEAVFRSLRGKHNDVAMYSSGFHHGILTLYFSPAANEHAAPLLRQIGAEACDKPADIEGFLVGHTGTMRKLLTRES
jgi:hypothetical protein